MVPRSRILLVLSMIGVVISLIMFANFHSVQDGTDGTLFGLTQLLLGFSIGVTIGTYLGLKSEQIRLEQIIPQE